MKSEYLKFLNKIVGSKEFAHSENLKKLLHYLVNCSFEGKAAKETQIAADVFERDLTENDQQDSTIVRVNIHNLRKKLSHYYLTEGKNDIVQFIIPKGRYKVEFIENSQTSSKNKKAFKWFHCTKSFQIISTLLIIALISFFIFLKLNEQPKGDIIKSAIWKNFTENQKPTMIVLGDYFFYKEKDSTESESIIRNYDINSESDLDQFLETHSEMQSKYKPAGFGYLGYSVPYVLKGLIPVFHGTDFEICLMSEFNNRYLQQYNIIFVGLYKTMGLFKTYFQHSDFIVDDTNNRLEIIDSTGNITASYIQNGKAENIHDDYAIAAKFPGPNHNYIFLFSSFHDIGIIECVKTFTTPELFETTSSKIKSTYGNIPNNFELLIKVIGANRTDISSEIQYINQIDPKTNYWEIN